ncbi:MAG TPA: JAB domain-containing protein [Allosphingosinicella sp.]|nr:JAB domain-containing protein [Allosphingosinicella sp.]
MGQVLVATARHAADLLASLFVEGVTEKLAVLYLDAERRMLGLEEYPGQTDEAALPFRRMFASALRRDAVGMVIAHNHPSGDPRPSEADIEATRRLAAAGAALDIILHDHLIFAGGECRSFRELGLL